MIFRTIGHVIRGKSTPFQLMLTCLLASALAFMPGPSQAGGLIVTLTLLLIVFNTNLPLAILLAVVTKFFAFLLTPLSFEVGRLFLDGALQGLFQSMINAPVLALFGFEYYTTTGGLVLGLILGALYGLGVLKVIGIFRRRMARLETSSERYRQFAGKKWVTFLAFILFGKGHGKLTYESLLARKVGNPIRPLGLVFVGLLLLLGFIVQLFAREPIVTMALHNALERANGATVDLQSADLNLNENRLTLHKLAMANPNNLDTDLLRAESLEADISGSNLLRKRLQLDRVVIDDASHGLKRTTPGHLIGKRPEPPPKPDRAPDEKTIDDYLENAKVWKERLAQIRKWLEKLSGPEAKKEREGKPKKKEPLGKRLERKIKEKGYHRVKATHLIEGSPLFTISELIAKKVRVKQLQDETINVTARNLSTHPHLLKEPPEIIVRSSEDRLNFEAFLGDYSATGTNNTLDFAYSGIPVNQVSKQLKLGGGLGGGPPLQGGTLDIGTAGNWIHKDGILVDLPLTVTLHQTSLRLAEGQPIKIDELSFPVKIEGPLDNPVIRVNHKQLSKALAQAGVTQAAKQLRDKAAQEVGKRLKDKLGGSDGKGRKNLLNRFLNRSKEKPESGDQ